MNASPVPFKQAVARILDDQGRVCCMGLRVSTRHVLTCVRMASDAAATGQETLGPPGSEARINLPFVGTQLHPARVVQHRRDPQHAAVFTLLELRTPLAPWPYSELDREPCRPGTPVYAWVPHESPGSPLVAVEGKLLPHSDGSLHSAELTGAPIGRSAGGCPLFDPSTGRVLGLLCFENLPPAAAAFRVLPAAVVRLVLRGAGIAPEQSALQSVASWARERYGSCWQQRAHVLKLIRSYQDTIEDPRPFAGRASVLAALDRWLAQTSRRFKLITGSAGRGKTALLLSWLGRLILDREDLTVLYLPISIRFNTADETSGLRLLLAALSDVPGVLRPNLPEHPDHQDYREQIASAWEQLTRKAGAVLLVIDGLDEALHHWPLAPSVLPPQLPATLHLLIAARHKPGHTQGLGWLADLPAGITCDIHAGEGVLELDTLDREAIVEALAQLGAPLDGIASRESFVEELFRLTDQGDPLLLSLWVGQLWKQRDNLPAIDTPALRQLQPSFQGFYQAWLKEQQAVWAGPAFAGGRVAQVEDFERVLHVLALAQGPLLLTDLQEVLSHLPGRTPWEPDLLQRTLASADRLVVGDGETQGYVLVHPRLAQHFQEVLEADPLRRQAVMDAFARWGEDALRRLNSGSMPPADCPRYLLTFHVAVHLPAGTERAALERWYLPLLQRGWADAWYACEGAWRGYLNDLETILGALKTFNCSCVQTEHSAGLLLGAEARCVLLTATIRSLTLNLPSELIVALARAEVWSVARAARAATESREPETCLIGLAGVARMHGNGAQARSLLLQALGTPPRERHPGYIERLKRIATELPGDEELLQQALAAVRSQGPAGLIAAAEQLPPDSPLMTQVLAMAAAIAPLRERVWALSRIAALLQGPSRRPVLQEALAAAGSVEDGDDRADALIQVAEAVQNDPDLQAPVLAMAAAIPGPKARSWVLGSIGGQLHGEMRKSLLRQALEAAVCIEPATQRCRMLCKLADKLRGDRDLLRQALIVAAALPGAEERRKALYAVAVWLPVGKAGNGLLHQQMLREVVLDEADRTWTLEAITSDLAEARSERPGRPANQGTRTASTDFRLHPESEETRLLRMLSAARVTPNEYARVDQIRDLAESLRGRQELLRQALAVTGTVQNRDARGRALSAIAAQLQNDAGLTRQALELASAIQDDERRVRALIEISTGLMDPPRHAVVQQALAVATIIWDDDTRARALAAVAVHLPAQERLVTLRLALAAALSIAREYPRSHSLCAVIAALETEPALLEQAFAAATALENEVPRARVLAALATAARGDRTLFPRILSAVTGIQGRSPREEALCALISLLQADGPLLRQALNTAAEAGDELAEVFARSVAAAGLPEYAREAALQPALTLATAIPDAYSRVRALAAIAAQLQGESQHAVLEEALGVAEKSPACGQGLCVLAPLLEADPGLLKRAFEAAKALENGLPGSLARAALAPRLAATNAPLPEASSLAEALVRQELPVHVLNALATRLQADGPLQTALLEHLFAKDTAPLWWNLLGTSGAARPFATLARLAPAVLTYERWSRLLAQARSGRPHVLTLLGDLAGCATQLTGRQDDALEIARAVQDVCAWRP
jgi:hypothetical protein